MDEAVQRWLTAQQEGKRRRVSKDRPPLAPWVENAYFDLPIPTVVTFSGSVGGDPVVNANPQRVVLIFSAGNGVVNLFLDNDKQSTIGMVVPNNFPPTIFTQREHGPLATMAWRGAGGLGQQMYVIELILREWP